MDEMYQLKKEIRITQMETKRMAEEVQQRLGVVDGRIQAGESNLRALDRREVTNTNAGQQGVIEVELKLKETQGEMARFKRVVEGEVRGIVDAMKSELRQREGIIQQLDASVRGLQLQVCLPLRSRNSRQRRQEYRTGGELLSLVC